MKARDLVLEHIKSDRKNGVTAWAMHGRRVRARICKAPDKVLHLWRNGSSIIIEVLY